MAYNVPQLGVCYFALQTFQTLDKFNRQNNSTKPLLVAGAVN
jgi:Na+-translocating ferredoxin:NAD+ oxidoreductase RnfC subunit